MNERSIRGLMLVGVLASVAVSAGAQGVIKDARSQAAISSHSVVPQAGICAMPSHRPSGAQKIIITKAVKAAKRESPPAFLAAMFQLAWISPARTMRESAPRGTA